MLRKCVTSTATCAADDIRQSGGIEAQPESRRKATSQQHSEVRLVKRSAKQNISSREIKPRGMQNDNFARTRIPPHHPHRCTSTDKTADVEGVSGLLGVVHHRGSVQPGSVLPLASAQPGQRFGNAVHHQTVIPLPES